ncbi:putative DNA ligase 1 [Glarea lozoyensis 74030]|uniref:Putative DNA ligase 1 n=1 Tax=Glarea lozoyensis (strain ATCC 74030 / MF5533) TaxID=1104152 RepID=H0EWE9_GLAL7|nr:putative DNA ligase 1 [Glarea lozoyensis 74030]
MPPKQATLGYVKDPQTTLRKFFKSPSGTAPKEVPKQSKLAFSTKSNTNGAAPSLKPTPKEDVEMKEDSDSDVKSKISKDISAETKENVKSRRETKKRSRSPMVKDDEASESRGTKVEVVDPDEDDEPVLKRPRRSVKVEEDEEDEEPVVSKSARKSTAKSKASDTKKMPPPSNKPKKQPEKAVKVEEEEVMEIVASKSNSKVREASASESASEAEETNEQEEEDSEDEKPEIAAKAREKVQTTLMSKAKDPYPDWKPGEPVPYAALCTTFSFIEMTTKRLIIQAHCSLFLRQVLRLTPGDMLPTVLLMINKLAADYAGVELGIGESLIMKAIGETTGRSLPVIKQDQKEIGDLGLVAVKSRANQPTMFKPKALTVQAVHRGLLGIATVSGNGAQARKVDGIKKLLAAADGHAAGKVDITKDKGGPSEAKFIVRFLEGKLRLGLAEKTVLVSLGQAMVCHEIEKKGSGKVPSTEQLAKGESILKQVFR